MAFERKMKPQTTQLTWTTGFGNFILSGTALDIFWNEKWYNKHHTYKNGFGKKGFFC